MNAVWLIVEHGLLEKHVMGTKNITTAEFPTRTNYSKNKNNPKFN